jgi:hypothetical protein
MIDLNAYPAIQTNLFVRIDVPTLGVLRFSDYYKAYTINSESYTSLGSLVSVSDTISELKLSSSDLNISISGIPTANMDAVLDYKIKGAPIIVYRVLYDVTTGLPLSVSGNPGIKFKGIINNYNLVEEFDEIGKNSSVTINFACTSEIGIIQNRVSGRRTNPDDQKKLYPTDVSMDRVPSLVDANFNFGAPLRSNA